MQAREGRERGRHRIWAVSTEPDEGLEPTNCGIMTRAKVGHSTNQVTQVPRIFVELYLQPLPTPPTLPGVSWVSFMAESSDPLFTSSFPWSAPSSGYLGALSHFISINSGVIQRGLLWIAKDTPITQEIPRLLGALCQEPRQRPNGIKPWIVSDLLCECSTRWANISNNF